MKKVITIAVLTITALTTSTQANLVINGDFESGDTGFTTEYNYNAQGSQPGVYQKYYIGDDSISWNGNFSTTVKDHTSGSGLMFMGDGSPTAGTIVWQQDVTVTAGTEYNLTAWATSLFNHELSTLEFKVGGQSVGTIATKYVTWEQFSGTWTASTSGSVSLSITDLTTAAIGNDFAMDDIAFTQIPEPMTAAFIGLAFPLFLVRRFFR